MNLNLARAHGLRHAMELSATASGQYAHTRHVRDMCDYVDAVAEAVVDALQQQLSAEVQKQLQQGKVSLNIDQASVQEVKNAINDMLKPWMK